MRFAKPACSIWLVVVVTVYYRRAWVLLLGGPGNWDLHAAWVSSAAPLLIACCVIGAVACARTLRHAHEAGPSFVRGSLALWPLLALLLPAGLAGLVWPSHIQSLVPWFADAAQRAAVSAAAAGLVLFDGYIAGAWLLRILKWRSEDCFDRLLFRIATGLGALSYLLLVLALAGWYRPTVVLALLAVLALGRLVGIRPREAGVRCEKSDGLRPDSGGAFFIISAIAVGIALIGALAPEIEYDALWYHLWLPKQWLLHGRPVDIPGEYVSLYPLTWEMLYGAGLAVGGPVAAKLIHFSCLSLVGLAVWQFVRRFFPAVRPWLACAITLTCPTLLWEATTAYLDLALALYVTLGLYALLTWMDATKVGPDGLQQSDSMNAWFATAAICFGLAAAIKHLGLIVLPVVIAGLLIWRKPRNYRAIAALAVIAVLIPFPWYLRSWLASGNPVFPEMYTVFGAQPSLRWDALSERGLHLFKAHFGTPRTPLNLALLPWNVTVHGALFGGCIGPVFLIALPALFLRRVQDAAFRRISFVVVAYVALWASPLSSFQMRFLVPIVPLLAVLAAAAIGRLLDTLRPRERTVALAAVWCLLVLNLPPFTPLHEGDRDGWNGWLTHVIRHVPLRVVAGGRSEDGYLRETVPTYGAWSHAAARLAPNARVLEFGGGDNFYASSERISMDAPVARDAWASGENGSRRAWQSLAYLRITDVLFDKAVMSRLEKQDVAIASPPFRSQMRVEYEDEYAVLYRLR